MRELLSGLLRSVNGRRISLLMKPIFKLFVSLFILAILTACAPPQGQSESAQTIADTLYENGVIWTGKSDEVNATILAVKDGKVFYVGPSKKLSSKTRIDLNGAFIMPGFIDNHVHFMEGGAALSSVDLRDANSPEDFSNRIINYAQSRPEGRWVLNGNWDHELWGGKLPHKDWIDAQTPNAPVYVIRLDGHMGLANSAALKLAGIDKNTQAPEGAEISRKTLTESRQACSRTMRLI